ncbi:unnamed protein product [Haemonchus placei]|uniref:Uncharacterized protein n=1 Tax=Haemonchus placei TaxID=6290 RepID=A0A0N4WWY2_HAEPC|nr:unnamed protein product [Haemonchus placei]
MYMKLPREEQLSQNPKLVNPCEGPHRVLDTSECSAPGAETLVRVPFDMVVKLPAENADHDGPPAESETTVRLRAVRSSGLCGIANADAPDGQIKTCGRYVSAHQCGFHPGAGMLGI